MYSSININVFGVTYENDKFAFSDEFKPGMMVKMHNTLINRCMGQRIVSTYNYVEILDVSADKLLVDIITPTNDIRIIITLNEYLLVTLDRNINISSAFMSNLMALLTKPNKYRDQLANKKYNNGIVQVLDRIDEKVNYTYSFSAEIANHNIFGVDNEGNIYIVHKSYYTDDNDNYVKIFLNHMNDIEDWSSCPTYSVEEFKKKIVKTYELNSSNMTLEQIDISDYIITNQEVTEREIMKNLNTRVTVTGNDILRYLNNTERLSLKK